MVAGTTPRMRASGIGPTPRAAPRFDVEGARAIQIRSRDFEPGERGGADRIAS